MDTLLNGVREALVLLLTGDATVVEIVWLSLRVSGAALALSTLLGIPVGLFLGMTHFWGRQLAVGLVYTGMGFPPVVIGLLVYLVLSRSGPLGGLGWLFTPAAMILAQTIIALPLVAGFTMTAVEAVDPAIRQQVRALGATPVQESWTLLQEAKTGVIAAIIAGFGGIISEVGAVMLVGGNVEHATRVLTTAIVLETRQGDFARALALGIILLTLTFLTNLLIMRLQGTPPP